jgi:hypothetical protein
LESERYEEGMKLLLTTITLVAMTISVAAQWLSHPTPGIPRTADGKANLTAVAPRAVDGKPDLTGVWTGALSASLAPHPDPSDVHTWAKDVARQRADGFFKDRPSFRCLPSGPEGFGGWKRILQTPAAVAILNEDLTYRVIHMDGRQLEANSAPSWMGYSVGRWDGDTLVVDSVGFNDKTWLNSLGLPHTEALRMTERYQRKDFGHLRIDVTFTDPVAFVKPLSIVVNMELAADTEMLEAVCEVNSDHWVGGFSASQKAAVRVAPELLATYVGVYSGPYAGRLRTVEITLVDGELLATPFMGRDKRLLVAESDTQFLSTEGLLYQFVRDQNGFVTHLVEIHVSGNYPYKRQR